jgi:predicted ATPase/transcriptional regulator with XRE-family HTH domain
MTFLAILPGPDASATPATTFGELLRDHRRAAGLTQEAFAERSGVSPRTISDFERGGGQLPRRDTVALLARALGLTGAQREEFERLVNRSRIDRPVRMRLVPTPPRSAPAATELVAAGAAHNLPRSLTSFVGREYELAALGAALSEAPLLTLLGTGGVGKTRLAQELLRTHSPRFADGGWLVDLAGLADPVLLPDAVAAALGARQAQARDSLSALTEYLRPKQLLLLLDNCEHLVEPCARLVAHLLRWCPRLHVLAASRESLAIMGETIRRVLPLELPDQQRPVSVDQVSRLAAVRLFLDRAQAANNGFVPTAQNAAAIARICIRLDGIPLALELAAAQTRVLSVGQLADRLERDSGGLANNHRASLPRHRTMRAAIDWSHDLLTSQEQVLLRRLAVFAGGCTLEMVEQVCSGAGVEVSEVLGILAQLVDKSMVVVDMLNPIARYRLLEPIRQYGLERLTTAGERDTFRARHAAVLLELAWTGTVGVPGPRRGLLAGPPRGRTPQPAPSAVLGPRQCAG